MSRELHFNLDGHDSDADCLHFIFKSNELHHGSILCLRSSLYQFVHTSIFFRRISSESSISSNQQRIEVRYDFKSIYDKTFILFFYSEHLIEMGSCENFIILYHSGTPIEFLAELYHNLCDGIALINSSLTIQLVPLIVYFLTTNILMALSMLRVMISSNEFILFQAVLNASWFSIHAFIMVLLVYAGSSMTSTAQETSAILSKIAQKEIKSGTGKVGEISNILSLLQYRNLHLQNAIFKVDWSLLIAVSSKTNCENFNLK